MLSKFQRSEILKHNPMKKRNICGITFTITHASVIGAEAFVEVDDQVML